MQAWCGISYGVRLRPGRQSTAGLRLSARATLRSAAAAVVPAAGSFIVVGRAAQFSGGEWLPAVQGGWGVAHLQVPQEYGTVIGAERTKDAPVNQQEDGHGILAKATIGSEAQAMQIRSVLRLSTELNTGDAITVAGLVWYVAGIQEIWAAGEWAELVTKVVRWPSLPRVKTFGPQTM